MIKRVIILLIIISISFSEQNHFDEISIDSRSNKSYKISKIPSSPIIDGLLEDAVWEGIPAITDFIQDEPFNMAIPTAKNKIKIAYDQQFIYIAARLFDVFPDKITKHMARRDDWRKVMMSDWFSVEIDSYHDHQTGFEFLVNSMGVQFDDMVFDDYYRNTEWNAVWEAEVSFDEHGWNVEMRIPFSVLRFSDDVELTMGINLNRYLQRENELMSWVVSPRAQAGIASKFGHLIGITGLERREIPLSIKPYVTSGAYKYDHHHLVSRNTPQFDKDNILGSGQEGRVGMDIKYLITPDIVNDIALNPDYGQIEADPADINITYFETYFIEKRPFFMENATLFDTPIEVFYSRRIGTNRDYMMGDWQAQMNSIVKYAGKISGKTKKGLSFGVISAVTNDDYSSWIEVNSNSHFLVSRVTQDLFEGNSYIGFLSTIYNDNTETDYVNSIDMLSYFWNNQLIIDWQIINSQSDHSVDYNGIEGKSGNGLSLEMNYNPTTSRFYSSIDIEYFDRTLNINDVGFLYRNNLKKVQGGVGFHWPGLDLFPISEGRVDFNFNRMSNLDNLVLNNSMGLSGTVIFDNLWLRGGFNYLDEHNDDLLLYDYYIEDGDPINKADRLGPPIMIPKGTEINAYFGNDPHGIVTIKSSVSLWNNDYEDGTLLSISFGMHTSEYFDFDFEYSQSSSDESFRWLEALYLGHDNIDYIFASSENHFQKYIFEMNFNYDRETSIQLYAEYHTNYNKLGQFYKYQKTIDSYIELEESSIYNTYENILDNQIGNGLISPQDDIYHYTKDHILNLNVVLNHEFRPGSNIYLVYSIYRDVVGKRMGSFSGFLRYVPSETDLAEVNFTQSLYLKMDYWFDF